MGAWGEGSFDNDDALDFLGELWDSKEPALLTSTFQGVLTAAYIEAPQACFAIAAGEIVAAMHGKPADDLPPEALDLVADFKDEPIPPLCKLAGSALALILENSELKELWEEGGEKTAWHTAVQDLIKRLK